MISVLAEAQQAPQHSSIAVPTVLLVALIGSTVYYFGYHRAVMHRANTDYKTTKAAVPALRKGFWAAWWRAVKVGAIILIAACLMLTWAFHEIRHDQPDTSTPATRPSSVKPVHPRR